MAEFKEIDLAGFKAADRRGKRANATPHAVSARFDRRTQRIVVDLDTGISFAFDPKRARGLSAFPPESLAGVRVEGVGGALHFPALDADFTVSRLLEDFVGPLDWSRREARALASRENGKKGGRPKRDPAYAGVPARR